MSWKDYGVLFGLFILGIIIIGAGVMMFLYAISVPNMLLDFWAGTFFYYAPGVMAFGILVVVLSLACINMERGIKKEVEEHRQAEAASDS